MVLRREKGSGISAAPRVDEFDLYNPLDANLDCCKDGDNDTGEEDDNLEGRDTPEPVERLGSDDEISDGVDDDSCQRCIRDVEEDGREKVDGEEDDDAGNDTGQRRAYSSLRLDGCSRE